MTGLRTVAVEVGGRVGMRDGDHVRRAAAAAAAAGRGRSVREKTTEDVAPKASGEAALQQRLAAHESLLLA